MKRLLIWMTSLICLLGACACAEEMPLMPQAVYDLCAQAHPGYAVAAHDGWGDETSGQFALILQKDGDNILCMAEKAKADSVYQLTIDNTNAVYDGDLLPSVLIDTGGDSLWYTYRDETGSSSVHYGSIKSEGRWGQVSTISYWPKEDGFTGMNAWVSDGMLQYEETDEDENENIRDRWRYAPIEVSEEYAQSLELAQFDINTFDADPRDGLHPLTNNDAFAHAQYEEMIARMDMADYALVSNPNPEDRLHLRAKPDKGSHSYGKFYNRTPVLVLERGDTWTKVQIGRGGAAMTGYMMTEFLAFDEDEKAALKCAFPQMRLKETHRDAGVRMHAEPKSGAVTARLFRQESDDFIIGVSGDEWYVVLRADGAVGYVPKSAFWAGNG